MSLFNRSRTSEIEDPLLGGLKWAKSGWQSEMPSPSGVGKVLLSVARGTEGPTVEDRASFQALLLHYQALVPKLRSATFQLWQPGLAKPLWEESWPETAEELWRMLELSCVAIEPANRINLLYAFAGEVWPDAMFQVEVVGEQVRPLALDD